MEASNIVGAGLAVIVNRLLSDVHLTDKVILYVKDEGNNLRTLASALTSVVKQLYGLKIPEKKRRVG